MNFSKSNKVIMKEVANKVGFDIHLFRSIVEAELYEMGYKIFVVSTEASKEYLIYIDLVVGNGFPLFHEIPESIDDALSHEIYDTFEGSSDELKAKLSAKYRSLSKRVPK